MTQEVEPAQQPLIEEKNSSSSNSITATDVSMTDVDDWSLKNSPKSPKRKYIKRSVINKKS